MADLACKYLGLDLRNPLIVSSSGLTDNLDKIVQLQNSGAGAIVVKSLFEEEIEFEEGRIIDIQPSSWSGADEYTKFYSREHSVDDYMKLIEASKRELSIPVIASINCIAAGEWINIVNNIESAGADAIELNIFFFPDDKDFKSDDYERMYYDIVTKVALMVNIPVTVKLGPYFTNILYIIDQIIHRGARGVVLFNRYFQPDIDLESFELKAADNFDGTSDFYQTLRWVSIISAHFNNIDIAASSGIYNSEAVIKLLLSGANTVMLCSALFKNGEDYLSKIALEISDWMDKKGFSKIEQFQGQLNYSIVQDPFLYERSQFIKNFDILQ